MDFIRNRPVETICRRHEFFLSIFAIQKLLHKIVDKQTLQNNKENKLSYAQNWKSAPAIMQPHICR